MDQRSVDALRAAFGASGIVEVYTAQRHNVRDKLLRREVHIQPWSASAAHDRELPLLTRINHRRGYLFMAREFERRMGHPLTEAPVWVGFDLEATRGSQALYPQRAQNESILTLAVPFDELLLSTYNPWIYDILDCFCIDRGHKAFGFRFPALRCGCTGRQRRDSWLSIFDLSRNPKEWQGVIDRIEPSWLIAIDGEPPSFSPLRRRRFNVWNYLCDHEQLK